jgi:hypothetical protein
MLPQSILRRRTKFGFETPQSDWLRGPLRSVLESWVKSDAPIWNYAERDKVRELCREVWTRCTSGDETGQSLMRLFLADRWLRLFFG